MNLKQLFTALVAAAGLVVTAFAQNEIKSGKALQITIQGVPVEEQNRINTQYSVRDDGNISMPFIGLVRAAGLRPGELAQVIQERYRSGGYYRTPTIQVFASTTDAMDKPMVTVGGQVRRTGPVEFTQGLTLYQAVQAAGGATEFGSIRRVVLFRNGNQKRYDISQPQFMSIPLQPSDTIEVPQKDFLGR